MRKMLAALVFVASVFTLPAQTNLTFSVGWDAVDHPDLASYELGWGLASGQYSTFLGVPKTRTDATINTPDCARMFMSVRSVGLDNTRSGWSNEVSGYPLLGSFHCALPAPPLLRRMDAN
jgi:hypothetical protein